ncbi:MAG: radical SAM protein, partial [Desulfobacterales bacterium]|nr:radical SAM protein [Desulfobacterales bacterium]
APAGVDAPAIIQQWEAVKSVYGLEGVERRRMPSPIWAERGYAHDGPRAWRHATGHASRADQAAPMSIYIHIPFCDQRCGFCDCYAIPLGRNKAKKDEKYTSALIREMDAWAEATPLGRRPVTTVHFGGGTPNCLEPSLFERIVRQCKRCFNITAGTELAIESTGALIAGERLFHLRRLGFTRLHVGVQTLEEPLRHLIGRRETAAA